MVDVVAVSCRMCLNDLNEENACNLELYSLRNLIEIHYLILTENGRSTS